MSVILSQITIGDHRLIVTDSAPFQGAGLAAEIGSMAVIEGQGGIYIKVDSSNTGWQLGTIDATDVMQRLLEVEGGLDQEIADRIADVLAEKARAELAESGLQSAITAEASRAQTAESGLQSNIDAEEARALAAEQAIVDSLGDEIARAQGAETTLQSNIDAEETRALAAEAVLQSAIASEAARAQGAEADLQSNIDDEETRALAAEAGLQSSLNSEISNRQQGDVDTLQDAKDYTDQKVSDLVASAPAVLDTLKELSDALGSDPNFATTISNQLGTVSGSVSAEETRAMAAEEALDDRIDLEISDRQAAVLAEKNRAEAAEAALQSAITQEVADRQADVTAEETRAMAAEEALDDKIDQEISDRQADVLAEKNRAELAESNLQSAITQEVADRQADVTAEENRAMAAEEALDDKIDQEISDRQAAVLGEKNRAEAAEAALQSAITQEVADRQADVTAEETRAMAAEVALGSRIDDEIADRMAGDSAEQSRAEAAEAGLQSQITSNNSSLVAEDLTFVKLDGSRSMTDDFSMGNLSNNGQQDTVYAQLISVNGDLKRYKFDFAAMAVSGFGSAPFELRENNSNNVVGVIDYVNGSWTYDPGPSTSIGQVTIFSVTPSGTGQNITRLDIEYDTVQYSQAGNLRVEFGGISGSNNKIINLADGVDSSDAINKGQLDAAIASEVSSRTSAVSNLQSQLDSLDTSFQNALDAEVATLVSEDNVMKGRLDILEGNSGVVGSVAKAQADAQAYADQKVSELVNSAPAVLDTLKELADALDSDPNFATTVSNQIGVVASDLSAEVTRATNAEDTLDNKIDDEIADRMAGDSAEQSRALAAEQALNDAIVQEVSDRQADVTAEETRAMAAEVALGSRIDDEIADRIAGDSAEQSRAEAAEAALQSAITQEVADRQADVNAEETRALAAEQVLQNNIDALETQLGQDYLKLDGSNPMSGDLDMGSNDIKSADKLGLGSSSPETKFHLEENGVKYNISAHSVSTSGAVSAVLASFQPAVGSVEMIKVMITGMDSSKESVMYERTVRVKNVGGTVSLMTVQSDYTSEDSSLSDADCSFAVNSSSIELSVTGVASKDISWKCVLQRMR